jgi:hypothetical protein
MTLVAIVITAFVLIGELLFNSGLARGEEMRWQTEVHPSPAATEHTAIPTKLDERDEIAALERIQYALSEVADGNTYVWRRWHGRLSGVIHPTVSFKDASGNVCRHLTVLMTTGDRTKRIEGIACRMESGRWRLEG